LKEAILTPAFRKMLRGYPKEIRAEAGAAISRAQRDFGHPHRHSGLGLRNLPGGYFEVRVRLDIRLVFRDTPAGLLFDFAGDHDEVRQFIKSPV